MTSKILQGTIANKRNAFDVVELQKHLNVTREKDWRDSGYRTKSTFSPSVIGGFYGRCSRYWYYAFNGAFFEEKFKPQSAAAMNNGTSSHERIQKTYEHSDVNAIIEKELKLDDPPIRGFADVIVTIDGVTAVGDIKTINASGYNYVENSMKPKPAHTLQVLIYMKILGLDHGFLHYENKDTHEELFIPVTMNARLSTYVDEVFTWMREVAANKELPKRCFTKAAPECKYCPLSKACWKDKEGDIDIPKLKVIKQ